MRILAIDPGTRMGWATWGGERVESGSVDWERPSDSYADRWALFADWLDVTVERLGPKVIVFENQVFNVGRARLCQIGYQVVLLMVAQRNGDATEGVSPGTVKKMATGKGTGTKDKAKHIAEAERRYGVTVADDNEADALLLLAWARENLEGANVPVS